MQKLKKIKSLTWAGFAFTFLFILLAIKLTLVMVHDSGTIRAQASTQLRREEVLPARRGDITDRNGNILATSISSFQLDADLKTMRTAALGHEASEELSDQDIATIREYANKWASSLSNYLSVDRETIYKTLTARGSDGKWLSVGVLGRQQDVMKLEGLRQFRKENGLYWLVITEDSTRYYPNGNMLAQTLGILDRDGKGRFGLEAYYDKILTGIDGLKISEVDKLSQDILLTEPVITSAVDGERLVTTIDEKIQGIAEEAARKGLEESKAKAVHIIVSDPSNGEILAIVTSPDFDLNKPYFTDDSTKLLEGWKNRAISDLYEPGSTFKIITMAAALSEGIVDETDRFYCPGYIEVDGIRIHCAGKTAHGEQNYFDIMGNSCNVGFIEIALKLGRDNLEKWTQLFGLGSSLGVDLSGEASGIIDFQKEKTDYALANQAIGQANLVTSLQLINDMNTVANNGVRTTPHLLKAAQKQEGNDFQTVETFEEIRTEDILDDKVAQTLKDMLEFTVSKGGSRRASIDGLRVMGKTGTAQKINPETGKYEFYVSSFVGAAPADDPRISVFVAVDEPSAGSTFGSQAAAPLAKQILELSINYLNTPQN